MGPTLSCVHIDPSEAPSAVVFNLSLPLWCPSPPFHGFRFWPSGVLGRGSLDPNTFPYPSGTSLLPFSIAIGHFPARLNRPVFRSAACQGARKNVRFEGMTSGFVSRWMALVGAPHFSRNPVVVGSVQRRVRWCVCGGVIWSDVPRTRRCSDVRGKGRPDMPICIFIPWGRLLIKSTSRAASLWVAGHRG